MKILQLRKEMASVIQRWRCFVANEPQNNGKRPCKDAGWNHEESLIISRKLLGHELKGHIAKRKPLLQNLHYKKSKIMFWSCTPDETKSKCFGRSDHRYVWRKKPSLRTILNLLWRWDHHTVGLLLLQEKLKHSREHHRQHHTETTSEHIGHNVQARA